jgi:hypothetical protein
MKHLDLGFMMLFTFEVVVRFAAYPNKKTFFFRFLNIMDIMAVLPFWMDYIYEVTQASTHGALPSTHIISMLESSLPGFCMLKLMRYFSGGTLLWRCMKQCFEALPVPIFLLSTMVTFAGVVFNIIEPENFPTVPEAMWFSLVTMSTVGYGDMAPTTNAGRCFASFLIVAGVLYISMPISIMSTNFSDVWENRSHILLAESIQKRFDTQGITQDDAIAVFSEVDADNSGAISFDEFVDMIHGLSISMKTNDIVELFMYCDEDNSGTVDIVEFCKMIWPDVPAPSQGIQYAREARRSCERQSLLSSVYSDVASVSVADNVRDDEVGIKVTSLEMQVQQMSQQIELLTTLLAKQQGVNLPVA